MRRSTRSSLEERHKLRACHSILRVDGWKFLRWWDRQGVPDRGPRPTQGLSFLEGLEPHACHGIVERADARRRPCQQCLLDVFMPVGVALAVCEMDSGQGGQLQQYRHVAT